MDVAVMVLLFIKGRLLKKKSKSQPRKAKNEQKPKMVYVKVSQSNTKRPGLVHKYSNIFDIVL